MSARELHDRRSRGPPVAFCTNQRHTQQTARCERITARRMPRLLPVCHQQHVGVPASARRDCVARARLDQSTGASGGLGWRRGSSSRPATRRSNRRDLPLARRCDASCAQRGGCAEGPRCSEHTMPVQRVQTARIHRRITRSWASASMRTAGRRRVARASQVHIAASPADSSGAAGGVRDVHCMRSTG